MKKLMVYLDEDIHEDLKALAFRKQTTMAALIRHALDHTFEDELDDVSSERALDEAARNPEEMETLDEYLEQRGLAVPSRTYATRSSRSRKVAESRRQYGGRAANKTRR